MKLASHPYRLMLLQEKNPHPRDADVVFLEEPHLYIVKGCDGYTSVTTVVHTLFPEFHEDEVISKMMASIRWPMSPYHGMLRQEIKDQWEKTRTEASSLGTAMHKNLESYYNGLPHERESKEWELFAAFEADHPHLEMYRTEMVVYDEQAKVAGSVDCIYRDKRDGLFCLYDYKRSKEVKMSNSYQKGTHPLTAHLDDCNYNHYSIQLGIYKFLLQKHYGMQFKESFLLVLHPNQEDYLKIAVRDLDELVAKLFEELYSRHANK